MEKTYEAGIRLSQYIKISRLALLSNIRLGTKTLKSDTSEIKF